MPDIFGREALDYEHLRDMREADSRAFESYLAMAEDSHNFDALRTRDAYMQNEDAVGVGYLTDNLQAMQALVEDIQYRAFRGDGYVPVVTDIPDNVDSYSYRVFDRVGRGRFIETDGTTAPSANVSLRTVAYTVHQGGIVPKWTRHDLRRAIFGGVPLDSETVEAATVGAMDHIEEVILTGDDARGFKGLLNQPTTGSVSVSRSDSTKEIGDMDADEIIKLIADEIRAFVEDSAEVLGRSVRNGLSIYLPLEQGSHVTETRLGDTLQTAWEYLATHNLWFTYTSEQPTLHLVAELEGAGNSDSDRMIVALNNRQIMEMPVPMTPRVIGIYDNGGFDFTAPIEYIIGPLALKRPVGIRYKDSV